MESKTLDLAKERSQARQYGVIAAVCGVLALLSPWKALNVLSSLALAVFGWGLVFHGTTAVSLSSTGRRRILMQVVVSIVVPLTLSLYFISEAYPLRLSNLLSGLTTSWILIPVLFIGYVSWAVGGELDHQQPFRGFVIAATVLFVLCFLGHHGIELGGSDEMYEAGMSSEERDAARAAARSGQYFGQYLLYVVASYASLAARLQYDKRRRSESRSHPRESADGQGASGR